MEVEEAEVLDAFAVVPDDAVEVRGPRKAQKTSKTIRTATLQIWPVDVACDDGGDRDAVRIRWPPDTASERNEVGAVEVVP